MHLRFRLILPLVTLALFPACGMAASPPWDSANRFRLLVQLEPDRLGRNDCPVGLEVCFPKILADLEIPDRLDPNSVEVIAYNVETGKPSVYDRSLSPERQVVVPSRMFYSHHSYSSIAYYVVSWIRTDSNTNLFGIYFDTMRKGPRPAQNDHSMIGAGEPVLCELGPLNAGFVPHVTWGDLDGDGVDDLIAGGLSEIGTVSFFKNIGNRQMPVFTRPERLTTGTRFINSTYVDSWRTHQTLGLSVPLLDDWDHDGDLDLYVSANSWWAIQHQFYENVGDARHYRFVPTDSAPIQQLRSKLELAEQGLADWNNNGQPERVSSHKRFLLYHATADSAGVPIAGCHMYVNRVRPLDIDEDDDLDIVVGLHDGTMQFCRNMGISKGVPYFSRPQNIPSQDADLSGGTFSRPAVADWDDDGDQDLFSGAEHGRITYFENIGNQDQPRFINKGFLRAGGEPITFHGDVREPNGEHWGYSSLTVLDWDHDGDPDVMATERMGYTNYYENVGSKNNPRLARSVRLMTQDGHDVQSNPRVKPGFHDWNDDGLIDVLIAEKSVLDESGTLQKAPTVILYNTGNVKRPTLKDPVVVTSPNGEPLPSYDLVEGRTQFCPIDWNSDGKMDFIQTNHVANAWPQLFKNVGSKEQPLFERSDDPKVKDHHLWVRIGHATSICAIDWDRDGRDDVLLGGEDGRIRYFNRMMFERPASISNVKITDKSGNKRIENGLQYVDIDRFALAGTVTVEDLHQAEGAENWIWNDNVHAHRYDALTLDQAAGHERLVIDPQLQGLYDIYLAFDVIGSPAKIKVKLSNDADWDPIATSVRLGKYKLSEDMRQPTTHFEQVYWKDAEMAGQKVHILPEAGSRVYLDYVRFIPQSRID